MKKIMPLAFMCLLALGCRSLSKVSSPPSAFTQQQADLIMAADTSTPMRVYKIDRLQDSILLRTSSSDILVDAADPLLQTFVKRLYRTVRDSMSLGVGIAAPQVGILKNIIWVQRFDKDGFPFEVYLNPRIVSYSKAKQDCPEGCLSIPGRRATTTTRAQSIDITYQRMDKTLHTETVAGFTAVIFQHEIDHLNGILFLDHLEEERKQ